jgi:hypothetical protein
MTNDEWTFARTIRHSTFVVEPLCLCQLPRFGASLARRKSGEKQLWNFDFSVHPAVRS